MSLYIRVKAYKWRSASGWRRPGARITQQHDKEVFLDDNVAASGQVGRGKGPADRSGFEQALRHAFADPSPAARDGTMLVTSMPGNITVY
jgi:hypothetical protein